MVTMWMRDFVLTLLVASCVARASLASGDADGTRKASDVNKARDHTTRVPPPIAVLPLFSWLVAGETPSQLHRELAVYSSGTVVLTTLFRPLRRGGTLPDAGRGSATEEYVRRMIPRKKIVELVHTLDRERFRQFPERFSAKAPRPVRRPSVRATFRTRDRVVSVLYEPSSPDRTLASAPAGWSEIESRVDEILTLVQTPTK